MLSKILGAFEILIGVSIIILAIIAALGVVFQNAPNIYFQIGAVIAFTLFAFYGALCIRTGWFDIKANRIEKWVYLTMSVLGVIFIIVLVANIFFYEDVEGVIGQSVILGVFSILTFINIKRLLNKSAAHNNM